MDRLQIAAFAVAGLLILAWLYTLPSQQDAPDTPRAEAPVPESSPGESPGAPPRAEERVPSLAEGSELTHDAEGEVLRHDVTGTETVALETEDLRVRIATRGGSVVSAELPSYQDRVGDGARSVELVTAPGRGLFRVALGEGPLEVFATEDYEEVSRDSRSVVHRLERDGVSVERIFSLDSSGYGARLRVRLENRGSATVRPEFRVLLYGADRAPGAPDRFIDYGLVGLSADDVERQLMAGIGEASFWSNITGSGPWTGSRLGAPVGWMGVESRYFLAAAVPENPGESLGFQGPVGRNAGVSILGYPAIEVPVGTSYERGYRLYLGPKVVSALAAVDPELDPSIQAGWRVFRPLVDLFAQMLVWTYENVVANYGVAIILITILIRLLTYPLTQKSMKSMKRLQTIAPQMKELQEKHKDDRERMQTEVMALYKRTGINPMTALGGGCVPMLAQFPFLIALYFALQASIELRHADFMLWINDLSAPENLFAVAGIPIRPLPLLMGATMVLQQRLTPTAGADPQQKQMMTMMSVAFIFLFYQFPSGLVLYWFVSNLLGIAQQFLVNRSKDGTPAAEATGSKAAKPAKSSKTGKQAKDGANA